MVGWVSLGYVPTSIGELIASDYLLGVPILIILLPAQTIIWLTIHWFLVRIGKVRIQNYILGGFVIGTLVSVSAIYVFATAMGDPIFGAVLGLGTLIGGPVGAINGAVFRLMRGPVMT